MSLRIYRFICARALLAVFLLQPTSLWSHNGVIGGDAVFPFFRDSLVTSRDGDMTIDASAADGASYYSSASLWRVWDMASGYVYDIARSLVPISAEDPTTDGEEVASPFGYGATTEGSGHIGLVWLYIGQLFEFVESMQMSAMIRWGFNSVASGGRLVTDLVFPGLFDWAASVAGDALESFTTGLRAAPALVGGFLSWLVYANEQAEASRRAVNPRDLAFNTPSLTDEEAETMSLAAAQRHTTSQFAVSVGLLLLSGALGWLAVVGSWRFAIWVHSRLLCRATATSPTALVTSIMVPVRTAGYRIAAATFSAMARACECLHHAVLFAGVLTPLDVVTFAISTQLYPWRNVLLVLFVPVARTYFPLPHVPAAFALLAPFGVMHNLAFELPLIVMLYVAGFGPGLLSVEQWLWTHNINDMVRLAAGPEAAPLSEHFVLALGAICRRRDYWLSLLAVQSATAQPPPYRPRSSGVAASPVDDEEPPLLRPKPVEPSAEEIAATEANLHRILVALDSNEFLNGDIANIANRNILRRPVIYPALSDAEKTTLSGAFPEFEFDFRDSTSSPHALAAAVDFALSLLTLNELISTRRFARCAFVSARFDPKNSHFVLDYRAIADIRGICRSEGFLAARLADAAPETAFGPRQILALRYLTSHDQKLRSRLQAVAASFSSARPEAGAILEELATPTTTVQDCLSIDHPRGPPSEVFALLHEHDIQLAFVRLHRLPLLIYSTVATDHVLQLQARRGTTYVDFTFTAGTGVGFRFPWQEYRQWLTLRPVVEYRGTFYDVDTVRTVGSLDVLRITRCPGAVELHSVRGIFAAPSQSIITGPAPNAQTVSGTAPYAIMMDSARLTKLIINLRTSRETSAEQLISQLRSSLGRVTLGTGVVLEGNLIAGLNQQALDHVVGYLNQVTSVERGPRERHMISSNNQYLRHLAAQFNDAVYRLSSKFWLCLLCCHFVFSICKLAYTPATVPHRTVLLPLQYLSACLSGDLVGLNGSVYSLCLTASVRDCVQGLSACTGPVVTAAHRPLHVFTWLIGTLTSAVLTRQLATCLFGAPLFALSYVLTFGLQWPTVDPLVWTVPVQVHTSYGLAYFGWVVGLAAFGVWVCWNYTDLVRSSRRGHLTPVGFRHLCSSLPNLMLLCTYVWCIPSLSAGWFVHLAMIFLAAGYLSFWHFFRSMTWYTELLLVDNVPDIVENFSPAGYYQAFEASHCTVMGVTTLQSIRLPPLNAYNFELPSDLVNRWCATFLTWYEARRLTRATNRDELQAILSPILRAAEIDTTLAPIDDVLRLIGDVVAARTRANCPALPGSDPDATDNAECCVADFEQAVTQSRSRHPNVDPSRVNLPDCYRRLTEARLAGVTNYADDRRMITKLTTMFGLIPARDRQTPTLELGAAPGIFQAITAVSCPFEHPGCHEHGSLVPVHYTDGDCAWGLGVQHGTPPTNLITLKGYADKPPSGYTSWLSDIALAGTAGAPDQFIHNVDVYTTLLKHFVADDSVRSFVMKVFIDNPLLAQLPFVRLVVSGKANAEAYALFDKSATPPTEQERIARQMKLVERTLAIFEAVRRFPHSTAALPIRRFSLHHVFTLPSARGTWKALEVPGDNDCLLHSVKAFGFFPTIATRELRLYILALSTVNPEFSIDYDHVIYGLSGVRSSSAWLDANLLRFLAGALNCCFVVLSEQGETWTNAEALTPDTRPYYIRHTPGHFRPAQPAAGSNQFADATGRPSTLFTINGEERHGLPKAALRVIQGKPPFRAPNRVSDSASAASSITESIEKPVDVNTNAAPVEVKAQSLPRKKCKTVSYRNGLRHRWLSFPPPAEPLSLASGLESLGTTPSPPGEVFRTSSLPGEPTALEKKIEALFLTQSTSSTASLQPASSSSGPFVTATPSSNSVADRLHRQPSDSLADGSSDGFVAGLRGGAQSAVDSTTDQHGSECPNFWPMFDYSDDDATSSSADYVGVEIQALDDDTDCIEAVASHSHAPAATDVAIRNALELFHHARTDLDAERARSGQLANQLAAAVERSNTDSISVPSVQPTGAAASSGSPLLPSHTIHWGPGETHHTCTAVPTTYSNPGYGYSPNWGIMQQTTLPDPHRTAYASKCEMLDRRLEEIAAIQRALQPRMRQKVQARTSTTNEAINDARLAGVPVCHSTTAALAHVAGEYAEALHRWYPCGRINHPRCDLSKFRPTVRVPFVHCPSYPYVVAGMVIDYATSLTALIYSTVAELAEEQVNDPDSVTVIVRGYNRDADYQLYKPASGAKPVILARHDAQQKNNAITFGGKNRFCSTTATQYCHPMHQLAGIMRRTDHCAFTVPHIFFVNGIAGCGKTHMIRRVYDSALCRNMSILVLTVSKANAADLSFANAKTITGFLSYCEVTNDYIDLLIIDEATMLHPGLIVLLAALVRTRNVLVVGDDRQIPYLERDPLFRGNPPPITAYPTVELQIDETYRMPLDAARLASLRYQRKIYTHNKTERSMTAHHDPLLTTRLRQLGQSLPAGTFVMTFTQEDKDLVAAAGIPNVRTIHESQGTTQSRVLLLRLTTKDYPQFKYERCPITGAVFPNAHQLVAITRHTRSFEYRTTVRDDLFSGILSNKGSAEIVTGSARSDAIGSLVTAMLRNYQPSHTVVSLRMYNDCPSYPPNRDYDLQPLLAYLRATDSTTVARDERYKTGTDGLDCYVDRAIAFADYLLMINRNENYVLPQGPYLAEHVVAVRASNLSDTTLRRYRKNLNWACDDPLERLGQIKANLEGPVAAGRTDPTKNSSDHIPSATAADGVVTCSEAVFKPTKPRSTEVAQRAVRRSHPNVTQQTSSGSSSEAFATPTALSTEVLPTDVLPSTTTANTNASHGRPSTSATADRVGTTGAKDESQKKLYWYGLRRDNYEAVAKTRPKTSDVPVIRFKFAPPTLPVGCWFTVLKPILSSLGYSTYNKTIRKFGLPFRSMPRWCDILNATAKIAGVEYMPNIECVDKNTGLYYYSDSDHPSTALCHRVRIYLSKGHVDTVRRHATDNCRIVCLHGSPRLDVSDDFVAGARVDPTIVVVTKAPEPKVIYNCVRQCQLDGLRREVLTKLDVHSVDVTETPDLPLVALPRVHYPVDVSTCPLHLDTLQSAYDELLPGVSAHDYALDDEVNLAEDIHVPEACLSLNTALFTVGKLVRRPDVTPRLRTGLPQRRLQVGRVLLEAAGKRNFLVGKTMPACAAFDFAAANLLTFVETYCKSGAMELLDYFASKPITHDSELTASWLTRLDGGRVQALSDQCHRDLDDINPGLYEAHLKPDAKASADGRIVGELPKGQVINSMHRRYTAVFSPILREALRRFRALLDPRFVVAIGYSTDALCAHAQEFITNDHDQNFIEIDFSSFDKNARRPHLEAFLYLLQRLGVPDHYLEIWREAHYRSISVSRTGVSFRKSYQTQSGDASTAFVNTYTNMYVCADLCKTAKAGYFMGDDSLIAVDASDQLQRRFDNGAAYNYNFSSKLLSSIGHGYFCGMYLVNAVGTWRFMTDPVKRIEKFGRHDINHPDKLAEMWVSYEKLLGCYSSLAHNDALSAAVAHRYKTPNLCLMSALTQLHSISQDVGKFLALFSLPVDFDRPTFERRIKEIRERQDLYDSDALVFS